MSSLASSPKEVLSSKSKASLQKPLVFDKAKLFELPCSFKKNGVFIKKQSFLKITGSFKKTTFLSSKKTKGFF
jgi:hypothetical protein